MNLRKLLTCLLIAAFAVGCAFHLAALRGVSADVGEAGDDGVIGGGETVDPPADAAHDPFMKGGTDGCFHPEQRLTRAEMAQIVCNVYGWSPEAEDSPFPDVAANAWYTPAVNALAEHGVLSGYEDGSCRPENVVTRAEFVTVLSRLDGGEADENAAFADVPETYWGFGAISLAAQKGWVNGYEDGLFRPDNPVIRAEAVTMVNRFLGRQPDADALRENPKLCFFPDVLRSAWYYAQVMEAVVPHTAHYESPDSSEQWYNPQPCHTVLADGFHCILGNIYAVEHGYFVTDAGSGTLGGVDYVCAGESGVCTVSARQVLLSNGELQLLSGGKPYEQAGHYGNGFLYFGGELYAAVNGSLVHSAGSGTLGGVDYVCAGASGVCTVNAKILRTVDGSRYRIVGGRVDPTPGLYDVGSAMYCVLSSGKLLLNGDYHGLHFDAEGRYTSCYDRIDSYINGIYNSVTNASMSQRERFYACYLYVFNHVNYLSGPHVAHGSDCAQWAPTYMLRYLNQGNRGNCYCFAAQMYYFARRCGYWQAKAISGGCFYPSWDHGWLELEIDGVLTVTDPELEKTRLNTPDHLFLCPYGSTPSATGRSDWIYYK